MILMNFDGKIKGDCMIADHEDWITLDSIQFGTGRAITTSGGGKDRDTSTASWSEITVSKSTDMASGDLLSQACAGKNIGDAEVHWIQVGGTDQTTQPYLTVKLYGAIVSSYSLSSGGERPSESISISAAKVSFRYDQFKEGGEVQKGRDINWDIMASTFF